LTLQLNTIGQKRSVSSIESSKILSHMVKRMNSNLTIWQESALDDGNLSQHLEFEAKTELKNMLLRNWHCSETIRCPVCEENDLIVRLEEEQISKGNLHGINAHCINCDLNLQAPLLNFFLEKDLNKEQKSKILESYGIRIQK
jgi:hypothetical protein